MYQNREYKMGYKPNNSRVSSGVVKMAPSFFQILTKLTILKWNATVDGGHEKCQNLDMLTIKKQI